jgi:hypothetical protein
MPLGPRASRIIVPIRSKKMSAMRRTLAHM